MSQLNFYVPEKIEKKIKEAAKKKKMSISSYVAELVKQTMDEKPKSLINSQLLSLGGAWQGEFAELERGAPQERED